jgi:hypothetical protein
MASMMEDGLAGAVYRATEGWFNRVDAERSASPRWFALDEALKEPYREFARGRLRREGFLPSERVPDQYYGPAGHP